MSRVRWIIAVFAGLHGIAASAPGAWGMNLLHFYPMWVWVLFLLLCVGMVVFWARILDVSAYVVDRVLGVVWVLLGAGLFVVLRSDVHVLGDGALYIRELNLDAYHTTPRIDRAPLSFWMLQHLHDLRIGLWTSAEQTMQIYSIVSGVVYLWLVGPVAKTLGQDRVERSVMAGLLLTGGFMQLFFGYVETYAALMPMLLLYVWMGIRALKGKALWIPALIAGIAVPLHVSMMALWPSLVALAWMRRKIWEGIGCVAGSVLVALGLLTGIGASVISLVNQGSSAMLPLAGQLEQMPYHMFDPAHIWDLFQAFFLIAPGALMVLPLVTRAWPREELFIFVATFFSLLFVATVHFEIGAFRDWDVQAPTGFLLTVCAGLLLFRQAWDRAELAGAGFMICCVALLHTVLWIGVNARTEAAQARFSQSLTHGTLTVHARAYGWETLAEYYREKEFIALAVNAYQQALDAKPENPRLWGQLGNVHFLAGQYEEAIVRLKRTIEIKPNLIPALLLLGNAHLHIGELQAALDFYQKVLKHRPDHVDACYNMAAVYRALGDEKAATHWLDQAQTLEGIGRRD